MTCYLIRDSRAVFDAGDILLFDFFDFAYRVSKFYNLFGRVFGKVLLFTVKLLAAALLYVKEISNAKCYVADVCYRD
jgi:hypothetical protein